MTTFSFEIPTLLAKGKLKSRIPYLKERFQWKNYDDENNPSTDAKQVT